jgi:hypothetical protein
MMADQVERPSSQLVVGQKYAYATASLLLGIASFISLVGFEKAILTVVFAWLALKSQPAPRLTDRRAWAKIGLGLGLAFLVVAPIFLLAYFDRLREVVRALQSLQ